MTNCRAIPTSSQWNKELASGDKINVLLQDRLAQQPKISEHQSEAQIKLCSTSSCCNTPFLAPWFISFGSKLFFEIQKIICRNVYVCSSKSETNALQGVLHGTQESMDLLRMSSKIMHMWICIFMGENILSSPSF